MPAELDVAGSAALLRDYNATKIFAEKNGIKISQQVFLTDVIGLASQLKEAPVVNLCEDKYYFAVGLAASLVAGAVTLMPQNKTPAELGRCIAEQSAKQYLYDAKEQQGEVLEGLQGVDVGGALGKPFVSISATSVPEIKKSQIAIIAFTSGSTGVPRAIPKTWGLLCATAAGLNERFSSLYSADGVALKGARIVATVPAQHMYCLLYTSPSPRDS